MSVSESDGTVTSVAGDVERRIRSVTVGEPQRLNDVIDLRASDAAWPRQYAREEERVITVLRERALRLEHVGSTAVPGLAAKPIIDILLVVADSSDEASFVPDMENAGYVLRIREPEWHEHRMFKGPDANINLHVFSTGCPEIDRMIKFRDHLRTDSADRELYERTKRELASRRWTYVQEYADAKTTVVEAIIARARRRPASRRG